MKEIKYENLRNKLEKYIQMNNIYYSKIIN